jgi:tRNA threonylcarbamoyl adenosine modification protein (Sua5/YciO/YrdC/YwlC family)
MNGLREVRFFDSQHYRSAMIIKIHPENPERRLIEEAVGVLNAGGILIYPTDTVYGIGCSVENKNAIEKIYFIKRQRQDKPFSFVCSDLKHISEYAHVSNPAFKVMKHLIPGPYTFILPAAKMKHLPKVLVSKRKTVGIRVPNSPITLALVQKLGHPILSTSVSFENEELINDPELIIQKFRNQVEMIIDGGVLTSDPSSVIDLTEETPRVVRAGAGDLSMFAS